MQFGLVVGVEDRAPEVLAAEIVESMRDTDPKSTADVIGGKDVDKLGYAYRDRSAW